MRRVVVTGLGLTTPLGVSVDENWNNLVEARSGIRFITRMDVSDLPSQIAGQLVRPDLGEAPDSAPDYVSPFIAEETVQKKDLKKVDEFIVYAIAAAEQAVEDSGFVAETEDAQDRAGVLIGSGIGGLQTIYDGSIILHERGPRRLSPFFIPSALINEASGHISIKYGLKGPNHAVVTACSTGAHAIGDAARLIMLDDADVMVAGGAEAPVCRLSMAGFCASRAMSTGFNDEPHRASRPWDKDRDGFVMGEGAGVVVLEEFEQARKRGATIYAEIVGYGLSGDAYHITAPAKNGNGGYRAMRNAVRRAKLNVDDIDYVNAHGTSTPLGDEIELDAVKKLFGDHAYKLTMSSTKSAIGHLLGAAGSVEAIYSILALKHQIAPPTLNLDNPSEGCAIDLAPYKAKERPIRHALSNSFGFGGTNASLVFAGSP